MPIAKNILKMRLATGLNQYDFWTRFGVTQSGGSRYETGRAVPRPLEMLIWLRKEGRLTEPDLTDALKGTWAGRPKAKPLAAKAQKAPRSKK